MQSDSAKCHLRDHVPPCFLIGLDSDCLAVLLPCCACGQAACQLGKTQKSLLLLSSCRPSAIRALACIQHQHISQTSAAFRMLGDALRAAACAPQELLLLSETLALLQIMDIFYAVNELHSLDLDELKRAAGRGKVKGSDRPAFALARGLNRPPHRVRRGPLPPAMQYQAQDATGQGCHGACSSGSTWPVVAPPADWSHLAAPQQAGCAAFRRPGSR